MNKRFLFLDNGVLSDWTPAISNFKSNTKPVPFITGEDSLLIGSRLPFNNIYVKLESEIAQSSSMVVQYWSDGGWADSVEVIDETEAFSSSGQVTFTPNKEVNWKLQEESYGIPDLADVIIYNYYWVKITFTSNLDSGTVLSWMGSIFSDDEDLSAEFPDLVKSSVISAFQTGKINWQEQAVKAAELIESDLVTRGILDGTENILDRSWYTNASVQKVAELIFSAFGDDYVDQRKLAREEYGFRLVKRLAGIDKNNNAIEDVFERKLITGFFSR
jgi:hypothetical protein